MILLRNKNNNNEFFERLIQTFILFYAPTILKLVVEDYFTNEFVLTLSAALVFVWQYLSSLLYFLKVRFVKKLETFSFYKALASKYHDYNFRFHEINNEIELKSKTRSCVESEFGLNAIYFFVKLLFFVLFIFYFKVFGAKCDGKTEVGWFIIFIPIYFAEILFIIFCVFHFYSLKNNKCSKLTKAFSLFSIIAGYCINSVLIPLIAEGYKIEFIYVPLLFIFSSVVFCFHYKFVR